MNDETDSGVHWGFWVIGAVALTWNVLGAVNYVVQMMPDMLATYPESHRAIIEGRPAWATAAFAVAVFGGTLGSVLLLLRKSTAFFWFIGSLLGVFVTMIHTLGVAESAIDFSPAEIATMILMPLAVAVLLVWYSKYAEGRGWTS
jgi:hypothetical protein